MNNKALIAMSGGVDSSVSACLMKKKGFECIGITMKLFHNDDMGVSRENACCSLTDVEDARNVAHSLDMPYYVFNFVSNFKEQVIGRFVKSYQTGFTPNPCIDCNRYIKFDKLFSRAKELEYDYIVTGHYARIERDDASGRYLLKKAADQTKDQSYVLYTMTQEQLGHTIFPLGELKKIEVRQMALDYGLVTAAKHDSQDICFVPDGDYAKFIEEYTGRQYPNGNFIDSQGNVLGRHKGIIRYTIGQRKGLGLALPRPMYVCAKNTRDNTVTLGYEDALYSRSLIANDINLISCKRIEMPMRVKAKIRYKQEEQWATVKQDSAHRISVDFDEPQRAITKGQAVVLYDGDTVVGGGTIKEIIK